MEDQPDCTIIDCTLRDGGYYNAWDFHPEEGKKIIAALDRSGVSIAELGYRSMRNDSYCGLFKYCPESMLAELIPSPSRLEYSFMIDAKEFAGPDAERKYDQIIPPADQSVFSWCRVAAYAGEIPGTEPLLRHLKDKGYKTALNFMGISLIGKEELGRILESVSRFSMDVFYFADSFGSLAPVEITELITLIKPFVSAPLGFHAHANQGLEYINTLTALENGVSYIDSTLMGMGRGAGNLRTEQLLLGLFGKSKESRYNPYVLLDTLEYTMKPLHQKYRWGWDFEYMLSGIKDIHPTYCQELKSSHLFTSRQVSDILNTIPEEKRLKFNQGELNRAIEKTINRDNTELGEETFPPFTDFSEHPRILILARGPQFRKNLKALETWIRIHSPLVLECNDTGLVDEVKRYTVILNRVRFQEALQRIPATPRRIIYGGKGSTDLTDTVWHFPAEIGLKEEHPETPEDRLFIPYYNVTAYVLALAERFSPREIYLAGFDGDQTETEAGRNEKRISQEIFNRFRMDSPDTTLCSLTPTDYTLPVRPVYAMLP